MHLYIGVVANLAVILVSYILVSGRFGAAKEHNTVANSFFIDRKIIGGLQKFKENWNPTSD